MLTLTQRPNDLCLHVLMHIYLYTYIYVCMYVYIHMYVQRCRYSQVRDTAHELKIYYAFSPVGLLLLLLWVFLLLLLAGVYLLVVSVFWLEYSVLLLALLVWLYVWMDVCMQMCVYVCCCCCHVHTYTHVLTYVWTYTHSCFVCTCETFMYYVFFYTLRCCCRVVFLAVTLTLAVSVFAAAAFAAGNQDWYRPTMPVPIGSSSTFRLRPFVDVFEMLFRTCF